MRHADDRSTAASVARSIRICPCSRAWTPIVNSLCDPLAQRLRDHLDTIVATDVLRDVVQAHCVGQRLNHTKAVDALFHLQRQAGPTVLVDHRQDA